VIKGILTVGIGLAAVALARFFANAIAEERSRRVALRDERETMRWEGEGGNADMPPAAVTEF